jgi:hypothetical protein
VQVRVFGGFHGDYPIGRHVTPDDLADADPKGVRRILDFI